MVAPDGKVQGKPNASPVSDLLAAPVTLGVACLNVLVFILMVLDGGMGRWSPLFLVGWGADFGALTLNGEPWRLLTSTVVRLNAMHIAGNMSALVVWGGIVERRLGTGRYAALYGLSGLGASLTSVLVHPQIVSAGASGAIAGLLGAMAVMYIRREPGIDPKDLAKNFAINVALTFLLPVDWVAHLAGLVVGAGLCHAMAGVGALPHSPPAENAAEPAGKPARPADRESSSWHLLKGLSQLKDRQFPEAAASFEAAIDLNPDNAEAVFHRGWIRASAKDMKGAISDFDYAIRLNPAHAKALYFRGVALRREGRLESSLADFERVLRIDPTNEQARTKRDEVLDEIVDDVAVRA